MECVTNHIGLFPGRLPHLKAFLISCSRLAVLSYYNPATPFSQMGSSPVLDVGETELKFLGSSTPCLEAPPAQPLALMF